MKNRIIALLLAMVVVLMSFASCGLIGGGDDTGDQGDQGDGGDQSGNIIPGPDDQTSSYPWDKTTLVFQMTENSNHQELPSTCRRYLAGDITGFADDRSTIDDYVAERNEEALKQTNVEVKYTYLPDTSKYNWGENISIINTEVDSMREGRPDIYCNFVYDMVATSLLKSFANLLSTSMHDGDPKLEGAEHNYFEFTDPTFVDKGEGYMIDYMKSLTLSKTKMYCLSSDYFTDMVRAFLVVPVNIKFLESKSVSTNPEETHLHDRNGDGKYTVEDFYQLVTDGEWNYETLMKFAKSYSVDSGEAGYDLRDKVCFAVGTASGLPASGLLYTTSITIIDRKYDENTGDSSYSYPYTIKNTDSNGEITFNMDPDGTHEELIAFCDNLNQLFSTDGIIAVGNDDIFNYGTPDADGNSTDLTAIRQRFSEGDVLFGGVICLGSLEYDEYKTMNAQGNKGYGVVPVPLYRTNYVEDGVTKVDDYLTQIHNIGRVGAISRSTEKFAQCTAYLNYMSTHSTEILNEYYDFKLQFDVVGTEVKGNVEMLKYIRKHVRSSFDKAFEDALGRFYNATDEESMKEQWHTMIKDANFQLDDMTGKYLTVTPKKAWRLYNLETAIYPGLPA